MGKTKTAAGNPTYTEKQAAQLAALDAQIAEAKDRLQAAEAAGKDADAAQDAQGIVNARAAAKSAAATLERLTAMRKAVAFVPQPEPQDAYLPAVMEMRAEWQKRVDALESQIADANARLQVIDAALEAATIKADVAEAAKLTAERDALETQNTMACEMLAKAKALPVYDSERLRELWDAEDARIGREWRAAVDGMVAAADAFKRAWNAAARIRGSRAWTVAENFKEYLRQSDTPTAEFNFDKGMCWGTSAEIEATNLWRYRQGSFVLGNGVDLCRGTQGR